MVRAGIPRSGNLYYPLIVISDVHLGKDVAHAEELLEFLSNAECSKLIINGDFFDIWALDRNPAWKADETIIRILNRINAMEAGGTKVVKITGNHDEKLRAHWARSKKSEEHYKGELKASKGDRLPLSGRRRDESDPNSYGIGRVHGFIDPATGHKVAIRITDEFLYTDPRGRRILISHGDQFEPQALKNWAGHLVSKKSDHLYDILLKADRHIAKHKKKSGEKLRRHLAKFLKDHFQNAMEGIGDDPSLAEMGKKIAKFGAQIEAGFAAGHEAAIRERGVDGTIVGHTHHAKLRVYNEGKNFEMNSGDWVESNTFLSHDEEGNWMLRRWDEEKAGYNIVSAAELLASPDPHADFSEITRQELERLQLLSGSKAQRKDRFALIDLQRTFRREVEKFGITHPAVQSLGRNISAYRRSIAPYTNAPQPIHVGAPMQEPVLAA